MENKSKPWIRFRLFLIEMLRGGEIFKKEEFGQKLPASSPANVFLRMCREVCDYW